MNRSGGQESAVGRARIVVLGCAKGGTGKTTTAIHLIVGLLHQGHRVGAIDLDLAQGSLNRFLENRVAFADRAGVTLAMPEHLEIPPSAYRSPRASETEESLSLKTCLDRLCPACDVIVVDTAGGDGYLTRLAHAQADLLITPLNDSFLDLDTLARVEGEGFEFIRASAYADLVSEAMARKTARGEAPIDWIVMRNRLASLDSRNRRDVGATLEALSRRLGFRLAPGFSERVIYRELLTQGLTLADLRDNGIGVAMSLSHVAARAELAELLTAVGTVGTAPAAARA